MSYEEDHEDIMGLAQEITHMENAFSRLERSLESKNAVIDEFVKYATNMHKQLSRHHDLMDSDGMYHETVKILEKHRKEK